MYRIVGNFRGRKLSRIGRKGAFRRENFRGILNTKIGRIVGVACLEFRGENFRGWLKNREIHESFLPRRFPAIRYPIPRSVWIFGMEHGNEPRDEANYNNYYYH